MKGDYWFVHVLRGETMQGPGSMSSPLSTFSWLGIYPTLLAGMTGAKSLPRIGEVGVYLE